MYVPAHTHIYVCIYTINTKSDYQLLYFLCEALAFGSGYISGVGAFLQYVNVTLSQNSEI